MKMKKIVFAMATLNGGGAERVAAALAGYIHSLDDYEVHLITYFRNPDRDYPLQSDIIWHSMDVEEANPIRRILGKVSYMRSAIRHIDPICVISLAGPEMLTLIAAAVKGLGIPLIFSERNDPARYPVAKHLRVLRLWAYRQSDAVVFQTGEAMSFFSTKIQKKGIVIPNPLTQSIPERYKGARLPKIVTSCRLEPQKNLDLLINSFAEIASRYPTHMLYIYGEGMERSRLEMKALEMGLTDRIVFPGYSNHIFEDILQAALFVLPSNYEGISNSMLEAIALGVPTIATDCPVGGARETIVDGFNGILVPVGNKKKMVQAMIAVLSNQELSKNLSRNGALLREKLDISCIAERWLELIDQVALQPKQ